MLLILPKAASSASGRVATGIEALRSGISKSGDEIRFTAVDYVYRESEFRKKYVDRVVNPFLT